MVGGGAIEIFSSFTTHYKGRNVIAISYNTINLKPNQSV